MWPRMNTGLTGEMRESAKEVHELGQWPIPPSHLEPHLGPNLEKSVTMHALKLIFIYNIIHTQANDIFFTT